MFPYLPIPPAGADISQALTVLGAVVLVILANSDEIEVSIGRVKLVLQLRRKPRSRGRR
jgi:hypothetical protein